VRSKLVGCYLTPGKKHAQIQVSLPLCCGMSSARGVLLLEEWTAERI